MLNYCTNGLWTPARTYIKSPVSALLKAVEVVVKDGKLLLTRLGCHVVNHACEKHNYKAFIRHDTRDE